MVRSAALSLCAALFLGVLAHPARGQTPITVQIVNDSGLPDDQVYLLLMGAPIAVNNTSYPLNVSGDIPSVDTTTTNTGTSAPLACPTPPAPGCTPFTLARKKNGAQLRVDSPYSGTNSLPVYQFTATTVGSGVIYVSYNGAITAPPSPTVTSTLRFQPVELTYSQYVASNADLSSIDFYGIPIQLTTYPPDDVHFARPLDKVSYYASTLTLLQSFINASTSLGNVMIGTGPNGNQVFSPSSDSLATFLRVIGPNQVAAPGTSPLLVTPPPGAPRSWPYPSFKDYLDSIVSNVPVSPPTTPATYVTKYSFKENDTNLVSGYTFDYTGVIYPMTVGTTDTCLNPSMAVDGWYIKLTGTTSSSGALPADADICIPLPKHNPSASGSTFANSGNADFIIYGAVQSCDTLGLGVNGTFQPCPATTDPNYAAYLKSLTNSVYGWIQADVLSALNFGYLNGKWDQANGGQGNSAAWFNLPPIQYPFGQARATNDGFYNPWAAIMYNHSDAYGFAFSDRNGRPSPDIALPTDGGTLRIWILPDSRLDAPMVAARASQTDGTKLHLAWPVVPGAHHYIVTWSPPYETKSAKVDQPAAGNASASYTIEGLTPGSPYTVTVRAVDTMERQSSAEVPVYAMTSGSAPIPTGNADFNFTFNWTPPEYFGTAYPVATLGNATATYTAGTGYTVSGTTPITVTPPASTAAYNVPDTCPQAPCVTQTVASANLTSGGSTAFTVTISDGTPGATSLAVGSPPFVFTLPAGWTYTQDASTTTCQNLTYNNTSIVTGVDATLSSNTASCTIGIVVTPSGSGVQTISGAQSFGLNSGTAAAPSPVVVSIQSAPTAGAPVSQSMAATTASANDLQLSIVVAGPGASVDLALDFIDEVPPNLTVTGVDATQTTCDGTSFTSSYVKMAKGTVIPPTGCTIVANVSASSPGGYVNTTGILLTTAAQLPITSYPVIITQGAETIWSSNVYLTMLGTPAEFSVGACTLLDYCEGGAAPPAGIAVQPYDTLATPNFAERVAQPLSVSGGRNEMGPPFGNTWKATIGIPFTPVPNKKAATVYIPAATLGTNLCPWLPSGMVCP